MRVRIGITTRNRSALLPRAIESVLEQSYQDKEIVVYDIASDDETPLIRTRYPGIDWRRSDIRLDMISPRNLLMMEPGFDLYFTLDDDAHFLSKEQLEIGVSFLAENPAAAVLGYDILQKCPPLRSLALSPVKAHLFIACGALLRIDSLAKVGFYRNLPGVYGGGEETDLCLRLLDKGYEVYFWPGLHIYHEKTPHGRSRSEQKQSLICNHLIGVMTTAPLIYTMVMIPWKIVGYGISAAMEMEFNSFVRGLVEFVKAMPDALQKRSPVGIRAYNTFRSRAKTLKRDDASILL